MTKLEKLEKEYRSAMLDLMLEDGSPQMYKALQSKCNKLHEEIEKEKIKVKSE